MLYRLKVENYQTVHSAVVAKLVVTRVQVPLDYFFLIFFYSVLFYFFWAQNLNFCTSLKRLKPGLRICWAGLEHRLLVQ